MARDALCLLGCAALVLGIVAAVPAAPEEQEAKIANSLRVQKALQQGRDALQRGHYQAAVDILEREVERINGNRDYLDALRDAYLGLIRDLQPKESAAAASYRRRLAHVDPGAVLELTPPAAPVVAAASAVNASQPTAAKPGAGTPAPGFAAATPAPVAAAPLPTEPLPVATALTTSTPVATAPNSVRAAPPPQPRPGTITRGQAEDVDPLSDANRLPDPQARQLLGRAEEAFAARQYGEACRLYEQAAKADPAAVAAARERWAYCKMHGVVTSLNQAAHGPAVPPNELEREVRLAMSMAPKLETYGKDLLRKIQERQGEPGAGAAATVGQGEVRHGPRQGQWAVAETTNCRIFHTQAPEFAERVARAAETARATYSRKWLGEVVPTWTPRCDVYVHDNRDDYSKATGQPADCPGHSTISGDGDRVVSRRIDLHRDDPLMLTGWLPHEMTHVVLADRFGTKALPRWADEGMAVLSEPRERVELHLRNLPQHRRDRQLFAVADLMQFKEYPEGRYISPFYAQSVSLVDYLTQLKGSQEFTQFLHDGLREGFESSLRHHYNVQGFTDLQNRWAVAALGDSSQSSYANRGR